MSKHNLPNNLWCVLLALLTLAVPVAAQVKTDAPIVTINQVSFEPALTTVNVTWSAQSVPSTNIIRFEIAFEAILSDNSKRGGSIVANGSAREATVTILGTPNLKPIQGTKTIIKTVFSTSSAITSTSKFTFPNGPNFIGGGQSHPALTITQINRITQGCSAGQECFEVKWSTKADPSIAGFNSFDLVLIADYSVTTNLRVEVSATGGERQKLVTVTKPQNNASADWAAAAINANVTLIQEISVTKQTP